MGVFLSVADSDGNELAGSELGSHERCNAFLKYIGTHFEGGVSGSRFPTLVRHMEENEPWEAYETDALRRELETIAGELGKRLRSTEETDEDYEIGSMIEDMLSLARLASTRGLAITFG